MQFNENCPFLKTCQLWPQKCMKNVKQCVRQNMLWNARGKKSIKCIWQTLDLCSLKVLLPEDRGQQWELQSIRKMALAKCLYSVVRKIVYFAFISFIPRGFERNIPYIVLRPQCSFSLILTVVIIIPLPPSGHFDHHSDGSDRSHLHWRLRRLRLQLLQSSLWWQL